MINVRSFRGASAASDHFLVLGYIRVKINSNHSSGSNAKRVKFNLDKLKIPNTLHAFQDSIQKDMPHSANVDNAAISCIIRNVLLKSS